MIFILQNQCVIGENTSMSHLPHSKIFKFDIITHISLSDYYVIDFNSVIITQCEKDILSEYNM